MSKPWGRFFFQIICASQNVRTLLGDSFCEKSVEWLKQWFLSKRLQYIFFMNAHMLSFIVSSNAMVQIGTSRKILWWVDFCPHPHIHQTHFDAPSCVQVCKFAKLLLIFAQQHFGAHISTQNRTEICLHTQSLKKAILF